MKISKRYFLRSVPFLMLFLSFTSIAIVYAEGNLGAEPHTLNELQTVITNVFNIFFSVAAGVLLAMIAIGVWKSSMAVGNPQGLEAAKSTWTYALYGFLVIVLFFVIFRIIAGFFHIESLTSPEGFLNEIFGAIEELISVPKTTP